MPSKPNMPTAHHTIPVRWTGPLPLEVVQRWLMQAGRETELEPGSKGERTGAPQGPAAPR